MDATATRLWRFWGISLISHLKQKEAWSSLHLSNVFAITVTFILYFKLLKWSYFSVYWTWVFYRFDQFCMYAAELMKIVRIHSRPEHEDWIWLAKFRIMVITAHCVFIWETQNIIQTQLSIISLIQHDLLYLFCRLVAWDLKNLSSFPKDTHQSIGN